MNKIIIAISIFLMPYLVSAQENILSKKVTISFNNVELQDALKELQSKASVSVAFNNKLPGMQTRVNASFSEKTIEFVLSSLLKDKNLSYVLIGNQITIFEEKNKHQSLKDKNCSISGNIIDEKTKESVPYINVIISGTNCGTITNEKGEFIIEDLAPGTYNLLISAIGYSAQNIDNITVKFNEKLNIGTIAIQEGAITLDEVIISPGSFSVMSSKPLSMQTLSEKDLKNMSFSEDITRAVSRLPGVASNDYSSKFTVRGGETDEVLITLDGMELYDPFHQRDFAGGLFSIVDIETIQGVELLTGGFSAEFGTRQSGVFNMKTRVIPDDQSRHLIGISAINARIYSEGRILNNKGSYIVSARRGLLDQTIRLAGNNQEIPVYYDMFGKIEYMLDKKHKISFHVLYAGDKTMVRDIVLDTSRANSLINLDTISNVRETEFDTLTDWDIHDTKYSNVYSWITLNSMYNPRLFTRTILFTGYLTHERNGNAYKEGFSDKVNFDLVDSRNMSFFGIKQDWNWDAGERLFVKSGFDIRQLYADYNYSLRLGDIRVNSEGVVGEYTETRSVKKKPSGQQAGVYLDLKIMALPKLFIEPGLRYDYISYTDEQMLSPRVSVAYVLANNTFLRGAWGYYYQHQFINNMEVNYSAEMYRKAEMAEHYVLGFEHMFPVGLNFRIEAYYKDISLPSVNYQNLRDPWEVFPEARNDVVKLNISGARAKGIELFLKYDVGKKISWWFSYSLAKAEEHIDSIEFNGLLDKQIGWLPRYNNQDHTLFTDIIYRPDKKWVFNLSWQFWTGWPLTKYNYEYVFLDNGKIHYYPDHTLFRGDRIKPYHRLDVRVNRRFELKRGHLDTYLHVINLYNRQNVRKYDRDVVNDSGELIPDGNGGYITHEGYATWMGFVPAIGITWEF